MKKASSFFRQVISIVTSMVKAKTMAVKSKTSAIKTRLFLFGLVRNKKLLMSTITHKIHAIMGQEKAENDEDGGDNSKAIVLYNAANDESGPLIMENYNYGEEEDGDDDDYPDLRHSLFDLEDDDEDDGSGSVIDLVKNSRENGGDFSLEDEIDLVADVFIKRFHKQMKMQKLQSFKRYREMLERSV